MAHEQDRRRKSWWNRFVEVLTVASTVGIGTLLLQVGGYKEKIDNMCGQFKEYSIKNDNDHIKIESKISKTQQAIVAVTGKPID